ncbi:hypothetical protein [Kordia zhangzhouensis]|uniref:hypothetical protein n=1 Tax=Kordia zhangzhouensis TaxID=1620405 RepID=UPI000629A781|nr:hypothetical protein [Kordia zhangzhouensis]
MTKEELTKKIDNAPSLDFGDIFNESMELFKKVWLQGFIARLLQVVVGFIIVLISYIPLFMMLGFFGVTVGALGEDVAPAAALPMVLLLIVGILLIILISGVASMAISAAFFRICKMKDHDELGNDDYFYYFQKRYYKKMAVLVGASILISIPAALLCYLPLFYVIIPITFFTLFFAFNPEMTANDIISVSFNLGTKKWGITFLSVVLFGIMAYIVGLILCGIGVLFTMSFAQLPFYLVYKKVIGFDKDYRISTIGLPAEN